MGVYSAGGGKRSVGELLCSQISHSPQAKAT
jgi:hypothetical protein